MGTTERQPDERSRRVGLDTARAAHDAPDPGRTEPPKLAPERDPPAAAPRPRGFRRDEHRQR